MSNNRIVWKNQQKLKSGYTTGSCAAAAAKAAAHMLFAGETVPQISLMTPAGILLYLDVEQIQKGTGWVSCAVRKDSGDDPDVTNGILVYAKAEFITQSGVTEADRDDEFRRRIEVPGGMLEISLNGGRGVGRVTCKGLKQNIGEPAINPVPRQMILDAVEAQAKEAGVSGHIQVEISIPEGEALAAKTFNPRLGIEGGISVLGTSGIVEPMSEKALTETIYLEMKVLRENGRDWCYLVPGNYGSTFLRETLGYDGKLAVKCSNYIGETIDDAVELGMKGILLIGHVGKLIKLAAGVMNTHSRMADCRMEVLAAHSAMAGADSETVSRLMKCVTTTEALDILEEEQLLETVMETVMEKIEYYIRQRSGDNLKTEVIVFSDERGILGETKGARWLNEQINAEENR